MNILNVKLDHRAVNVTFTKDALHLFLADGQEISAPLAWFPRLQNATNEQRKHWRLLGNGIGIHWSDIDEDIAVKTLTSKFSLTKKFKKTNDQNQKTHMA